MQNKGGVALFCATLGAISMVTYQAVKPGTATEVFLGKYPANDKILASRHAAGKVNSPFPRAF